MKIVLIGGHHISALSLAKNLKDNNCRIFWFGTRYPRWPDKTQGVEYKQVTSSGIPFLDIRAGKFHRNILRWWLIPFGFFQSLYYLLRIKPDAVFSFGGYLAVPVIISANFLGIKCFTHEQTRTAGLANRFLKFFVDKIFVSWPESAVYFPSKKTIVSGLPLRKEIVYVVSKPLFNNKLPVILVAGGKQGSHTINAVIGKILPDLLKNYNVIHQAGDILQGKDFEFFQNFKNQLSKKNSSRYLVKKFYNDKDWGPALAESRLFIGRSGAHMVYELAYLGKPAIFIPLPFSYADEQAKNAALFSLTGAGVVIDQQKLTPKILLEKIEYMIEKISVYNKNAQKLKKETPGDAINFITGYLKNNLQPKK